MDKQITQSSLNRFYIIANKLLALKKSLKLLKSIFLLFFLFSTINLFSQELPDFVMPPEDAFRFTKYGDVPVNESTGRINLSIPLLTYEVGNLKLPMSLSYVGNGVKVNQFPSRTGINWTLQAGGVITRIVKSLPDDPYQNYYLSSNDLTNMNIQEGTPDTQLLNVLTEGNTFDTERDQFSFSFPGYSGSFYFDDNFIPKTVDRSSNLKIEVDGLFTVDRKINITTPDGTTYYFGGQETGISRLRDNSGNELVAPTTTAYYLYKIKDLYDNTILFEYDEYGKQELSSLTQKITYEPSFTYNWRYGACLPGSNSNNPCVACTTETFESGCYACPKPNFTSITPQTKYQVFNQSINKKLKRIYSNGSTREVLLTDSQSGGIFQLNTIEYKENSQIINKINFNYLEPNNAGNSRRFFLEEVTQYDHLNNSLDDQKQVYKMEYNNPEDLPKQFSYSQDYYGYYNAKPNTTFVPKNDHYYFEQYNGQLADRSLDFNQVQKGSLKKIYYPTKGYTSFEYEAPRIMDNLNQKVDLNIYHNDINIIPQSKFEANHYTTGIDNTNPNGVFGNQDITIGLNIFLQPGYVEKHLKVILTIEDLTTSEITTKYFGLGIPNSNVSQAITISHQTNLSLIDGHHYNFKLRFSNPQYMNNTWARVVAKADFNYTTGLTEIDGHGIRIKRVSSFTNENEEVETKRYYYKRAKNINSFANESLVLNPNPNSSSDIFQEYHYELCQSGLLCTLNTLRYDVLEYNSSQGNFPDTDNQAYYKYVTVSYGGDNFENGGVEKEFYFSGVTTYAVHSLSQSFNIPNAINSNVYGNGGFQNGKLLTERILRKDTNVSNSLKVIRDTNYVYDYSSDEFLPNFKGARRPSCQGFSGIDNMLLGSYTVSTFNNHLLQQTTTDYIDPLPITETDDTGYKKVINTIDYEYGFFAGLPTKTIARKSDDKYQIVRTYYPSQVNTVNDLNLAPVLTQEEFDAINNLKSTNQHRITTPIQVETYIKKGNNPEHLISALRNNYKTFSNGFTQMESMQSSKNSSDFEDRIIYHKYDNDGNPLELSKADGTKVVYQWASDHKKPLTKVENATYNEVQNAIGDLRQALPDAQVTTYSYIGPLHLLSSMTDPKGYTKYYKYDSFNRLEHVKDKDGNILSKNEYNYANQN